MTFFQDLKVMKIQSGSGTNCYVTPLNESSPTDLEKMRSPDSQVSLWMYLVFTHI